MFCCMLLLNFFRGFLYLEFNNRDWAYLEISENVCVFNINSNYLKKLSSNIVYVLLNPNYYPVFTWNLLRRFNICDSRKFTEKSLRDIK